MLDVQGSGHAIGHMTAITREQDDAAQAQLAQLAHSLPRFRWCRVGRRGQAERVNPNMCSLSLQARATGSEKRCRHDSHVARVSIQEAPRSAPAPKSPEKSRKDHALRALARPLTPAWSNSQLKRSGPSTALYRVAASPTLLAVLTASDRF